VLFLTISFCFSVKPWVESKLKTYISHQTHLHLATNLVKKAAIVVVIALAVG
jgi:hypothetical protein